MTIKIYMDDQALGVLKEFEVEVCDSLVVQKIRSITPKEVIR